MGKQEAFSVRRTARGTWSLMAKMREIPNAETFHQEYDYKYSINIIRSVWAMTFEQGDKNSSKHNKVNIQAQVENMIRY